MNPRIAFMFLALAAGSFGMICCSPEAQAEKNGYRTSSSGSNQRSSKADEPHCGGGVTIINNNNNTVVSSSDGDARVYGRYENTFVDSAYEASKEPSYTLSDQKQRMMEEKKRIFYGNDKR